MGTDPGVGDGGTPDPGVAGSDTGVGGADPGAGGVGQAGAEPGAGGGGGNPILPPMPDARGIYGHPDPNVDYPAYDGFTPFLVEEFNEPIDLDADPFWTWGDGALYEGMNRMVKQNITFENGNMTIRLTAEPRPGGYSFSAADNVAAKPLSSGEFRSIYNNFRFGRYEARMKAPVASNFIHTLFTYRTPAYILWREIDIELQAAPTNTFITNLIMAPPGTRLWSTSIEDSTTTYPYGGGGSPLPGGLDTTSDFHVYAFEWLPTEIRWYVDGTLIRVKQDGVGRNNLNVPQESAKIVMNLWVFSNNALGGGDPALNVYPIAAEYDWFRFYKWDGDADYPCIDAPACLPATDLELAKNNPSDPLPDIRPDLCTGADGMRNIPCGT